MEKVKINFVHISENAFFSKDNKLNIIGIFDKVFAINFPAVHPVFAIAVNISGERGTHKIIIEIISPEDKAIVKIEKDVEISQENGMSNFVANLIGIQFPVEGAYKIKVAVDNLTTNESSHIILEKSNDGKF